MNKIDDELKHFQSFVDAKVRAARRQPEFHEVVVDELKALVGLFGNTHIASGVSKKVGNEVMELAKYKLRILEKALHSLE